MDQDLENDALSLEYKRDYGLALRDLNVSYLINNPAASGVCRVFGLGLAEEGFDISRTDRRSVLDDRPDSFLVGDY